MNTRQDKVAKQIQKDMADFIRQQSAGKSSQMLTVTNVRITPDLGLAHIYISVFPSEQAEPLIQEMNHNNGLYRNELARRMRHQLRKVPEVRFHLDDTLDYLENIDNLLKK